MRCLLWRQHRGQLLWTAVVLAIVCLFMVGVAHSADRWLRRYDQWLVQMHQAGCPLPGTAPESGRGTTSDVETVSANCHVLRSRYPEGEQPAFASAYNFTVPVFEEGIPLIMVVIGGLVGAPLVAREIEQGTQLVTWTQSVPRRRWYVAKAGVIASALLLTGLVAGFANDRVQIPLTRGGLTSSRWPWFFSIDLVPAAEILLTFALAVAIGAYLRRTLAAVGASLIGFLALFLTSGWAVRSLTPLSRAIGRRGMPDDAWIVGGSQYHPAGQYWSLQLVYFALLLVLVGALLAVGWRATRPRTVV